jgi:hypothetical protein
MDLDKFIEKNGGGIFKMETLLKNYPIRYIVISTELQDYFTESYLWTIFKRTGNKIPVITNYYFPSSEMNLISTEDQVYTIKFDVPCLCGIYSDEEHP